MKDSSAEKHNLAEAALDEFLDEICHGSPEAQGEGLHSSAALFGFEDGLFVRADRQTYLHFVRRMRYQQQVTREVEWRQLNGRIASACIVESNGPNKRVIVMTMMHFDTGWKVMSEAFEAGTGCGL
jgi:hypothetical protein